jgi:hypothetical protein
MNIVFSYGVTNKSKAEKQNVNVRVYHYHFDFRKSTGLEIPLDCWDEKNRTVIVPAPGPKRTPEDVRHIRNVKEKLEDIVRAFERGFKDLKLEHKLRAMNATLWNQWCSQILNKAQGIVDDDKDEAPIFLDKFRQYIDFKLSEWKPNTLRNNESSYRMLGAFMDYDKFIEVCSKPEDMDLAKWSKWYTAKYGRSRSRQYRTNEIDLKFYRNLKEWHIERGNQLSGAFSDQIKHIKKVLDHFKSEDDIEVHHNIKHKDFKGFRNSPEHDILTEDELSLIFSYRGIGSLENVRDLIKVQYHMCMRYDELRSELDKGVDKLPIVKTSKGYRWTVLQGKVDERKGVPVHREVMDMIHAKTFPHIISNQKYNQYIKDLLHEIGVRKSLKITTHTIRRSFCTNKFNQGHSFTEIMHYSGHKTERQLRDYIRTENMDLANSISTGYDDK